MNKKIKANNPKLQSWIAVPKGTDFPIQNIPFGIADFGNGLTGAATRIGDTAINLAVLAELGYFKDIVTDPTLFREPVLNRFLELDKNKLSAVRERISDLFEEGNDVLLQDTVMINIITTPVEQVTMKLPVSIGDYTDFYSSLEHATNVGKMFRSADNALFPNWKHIPIGYHGRSSSIVISGTNIHRPKGQILPKDSNKPLFAPSKMVDFELETAFITCSKNKLGEPISIDKTDDHIFGMVLFNDLSARDIQKWEYVPLGPFLSKSFGSVVSPWIVTMEALEPFRVAGPKQNPTVLPYLQTDGKRNLDINLQVFIKPENSDASLVSHSNAKYLYWNMNQQLAHQTVNGCNINPGDMYGSGTISGPEPGTFGSMLELTWGGSKPLKLNDGTERKFINDNDTILMRGWAENEKVRIGFGQASVKILPAIS